MKSSEEIRDLIVKFPYSYLQNAETEKDTTWWYLQQIFVALLERIEKIEEKVC